MVARPLPPAIVARQRERARLARTLASARDGRSAVLLLCGAPGLGKSALLADAVAEFAGTVLRARAVETESELPFACLDELLRPVLGRLGELPARQAAALAGALALGPPDPAADRFSAYVATLGLLTMVAEDGPLVAAVDDAQWLDAASAEALAFAGRRLDADGVALVLAMREVPPALAGAGFAVLELEPMAAADIEQLLVERADDLERAVAVLVAEAADGNPLVALEVAASLPADVRHGDVPAPDPLPGAGSVAAAMDARLAPLDDGARLALLAVACCDEADLAAVVHALGQRGESSDALARAEAAGLVELGGSSVRFAQAAVRAAVERGAAPAERRALHASLAEWYAGHDEADRHAWHLAAAAIGPDDAIAGMLERTARQAGARRGHAAAERTYARAAELSTDREDRARLLCAAADEAVLAGRPGSALAALDAASSTTAEGERRNAIRRIRGRIAARTGSADEAVALLEAEGTRCEHDEPAVAASLLAEAVLPSLRAGRPRAALALARRAGALAERAGLPGDPFVTAALASALAFSGEVGDAARLARLADEGLAANADPRARLHVAVALRFAGEHVAAAAALRRASDDARRASAPGVLPYALGRLGGLELELGRFRSAAASLQEAERLASETGQVADLGLALGARAWLDAVQGRDDDAHEAAARAVVIATELGRGSARDHALAARGVLELGRGRPAGAVAELLEPTRREAAEGWCDAAVPPHRAPDLAEALARSGRHQEAIAIIEPFERDADRIGRPLARALALRVRGLLAAVEAFDEPFAAALDAHLGHPSPFEQARTQLAYGERLRRAGRRVDAREQLRAAAVALDELQALPWAERAREELRASGETLAARHGTPAERLTPHELQVARIVAEGASNREAGARLFLSPKTIEFHLSRVFRKLGVRSRTELARALAEHGSQE